MSRSEQGVLGGIVLGFLWMTACGPSAVCTSDRDCVDRFGPYSACILSGERGLCYVDDSAAHKDKRDDIQPEWNDAGIEDSGLPEPEDGGISVEDAGPGVEHDAGASSLMDAGTSTRVDAGESPEMPAPPQIDVWQSDATAFFVAEGVLLSWQVRGADRCEIRYHDEVLLISEQELASGQMRVFPGGSASYVLTCFRSVGEYTASSQSEEISLVPYADVQITSLLANDEAESLTINEKSAVRFSWSSENALSCSWSWQDSITSPPETIIGQDFLHGGEITFEVNTSGYLELKCEGNGAEAIASVYVQTAYISSFVADHALLPRGDETILRWTLVNSENPCELFDGEDWTMVEENQISVSPALTTVFQLRCTGEGGNPLEASLEVRILRIETFEASVSSIRFAESTTLSWQTHEAADCVLWQDDVSVYETTGENAASGRYESASLRSDAIFVLRCYQGDVVVESDPVEILIEVTITDFGAHIDPDVPDSIRLFWKAEATRSLQRCSLEGLMGFVTHQAEFPLSNPGLGAMTTYTLTCFGERGLRTSDQATVKVVWGNASDVAVEHWDTVSVVMGSLLLPSSTWDGSSTFQVLRDVGGNIAISNPTYGTLSLPKLHAVYGGIRIEESDVLEEISLPELREVGGNFDLNDNHGLTRVNAPLLERIGDDFRVSHSGDAMSLWMGSLAQIDGELEISYTQLASLGGLSSLRKVSGDYLRVLSNPDLACSEIDTFYCALDNPRPLTLVGNNADASCSLSCSP